MGAGDVGSIQAYSTSRIKEGMMLQNERKKSGSCSSRGAGWGTEDKQAPTAAAMGEGGEEAEAGQQLRQWWRQ